MPNSQLRLELDEGWEFLPDPTAKLTIGDLPSASGWRSARAGLSWNVQFDDLREYMGAAWYRTRFEFPSARNIQHVLLKFGAVDYFCRVYLNSTEIGSHEGGYTPFSFDLSQTIRPGENLLAIRVIDPPMDEKQNQELFPEMLYNEIPHGKQNWYVQNSGIWQGVRLEFAPALYVDRVDVTPRIDGAFRVDVRLSGDGLASAPELRSNTSIRALVYDNVGRRVWETQCALPESDLLSLEGIVPQPKLWGPEQPALYTMDVQLEGAVQYRRRTRFGFRELRAEDGKLFLNGERFYMIAALDQDFYPETIHTPSSEEFVREMMLKARRLGINVLRCHLKVAHPVYLDVANEVGMLVWAELPSWSDCWFPSDHFSYTAAQRVERMFAEMMMRDWNHPCLVIQTIMNESWGINLKAAEQRAWLKATFDKMKSVLQPLGRLVIDNSACEGNFHLKSDIEDFHNYYSQPDQSDLWDKFIAEFSSRASWTYSPFGDAERTGGEPLVVSEFGNWGLPQMPRDLPWWFNHSFGEREVTRPGGVLQRFADFKLDRVFGSFDELATETQWHQFASLKYEVETMRRRPELQGYCVTGMTDVHWEVNGLLDMWRNEKAFAEDLRKIQQLDVVMGALPKHNYYAGESVEIPVLLSHFSGKDLAGARVHWMLQSGDSGDLDVTASLPAGSVTEIGRIRCKVPSVDKPLQLHLRFELRGRNGAFAGENNYSIYAFPESSRPGQQITVWDPAGTAGVTFDAMRAAGWEIPEWHPSQLEGQGCVLSSVLDDFVLRHLEAGGRALVIADSEQAFAAKTQLTCVDRTGNWLDGRWFSNYNWIVPDAAPYRELGFSRILGFESRHVVPRFVIGNVAPAQFDAALAGITLGWVQLNHPLTLRIAAGKGRALVTTFRFSQYGADPYTTHLLHAYLAFASEMQTGAALEIRTNGLVKS